VPPIEAANGKTFQPGPPGVNRKDPLQRKVDRGRMFRSATPENASLVGPVPFPRGLAGQGDINAKTALADLERARVAARGSGACARRDL
jgi:hypothetical protein